MHRRTKYVNMNHVHRHPAHIAIGQGLDALSLLIDEL